MSKKKILICGATGFIGRNMAERFSQREDFEIYGTYLNSKPYSNQRIKLMKVDLKKENDVREVVKGVDVILQMAATTSGAQDITTRPYIHVTDNAVMNSLLLRAAFDEGVKQFIFPSCTVMYSPSEIPLKETDFNGEIIPNYFGVGWTKVYIEKMCEFFSRLERTKHTLIRHSNIYGPHDKFDLDKSHVFGATMTKVMTAEDQLTIWGSGEERRDLLYVSDLEDFVEKVIDNQETQYGLYNIGLGEAISINELVKKIISASGKNLEIKHDLTKPTIKTSLCLDTTRAKVDFGWEPKVSLEEGIMKTMAWYRENIIK